MGCIHSSSAGGASEQKPKSGAEREATWIHGEQAAPGGAAATGSATGIATGTGTGTGAGAGAGTVVVAQAPSVPPSFIVPDPDLGWRHRLGFSTTGGLVHTDSHGHVCKGEYPEPGYWSTAFLNERSNATLNRVDLVVLAFNIAGRTEKLANKFGVVEIQATDLLEGMDPGAEKWAMDPRAESKKVLKVLGCPDFGWDMLRRKVVLSDLATTVLPPELEERRATATVPRVFQELSKKGKVYLVDVAEIAMNMAEQLYRLEKADAAVAGNRLPSDTFGWRIGHSLEQKPGTAPGTAQDTRECLGHDHDPKSLSLPVASPDAQAMFVVPEELIMNVASWIQQTYLTTPVF